MTEQPDEARLTEIGVRMNAMMLAAQAALSGVTADELDAFAQHVERVGRAEIVGPPNLQLLLANLPYDAFQRVGARVSMAKFVLEDMEAR